MKISGVWGHLVAGNANAAPALNGARGMPQSERRRRSFNRRAFRREHWVRRLTNRTPPRGKRLRSYLQNTNQIAEALMS
jgi:hypothetical protein